MLDKRILIVEDHKEISDILAEYLIKQGYMVECVYDGLTASKKIASEMYTIILMDLMLPFKTGEELIKELREKNNTPVICLSAKTGIETRLEVLRMGADDYILKPFDLDEVLVRIEVVLRRGAANGLGLTENAITELTYNELRVSISENRAYLSDKEITLTHKELELLKLFLSNPTKTFTKANLYEAVWNEEYCYEDNTVNVHVSNLRNKLKKLSGADYIDTVWGIGYRLKTGNKG